MSYRFTINEKIKETLSDFKALLPRYRELKEDRRMLHLFFSRNRNPLWDLSSNKIFRTGLKSSKLTVAGGVPVEDHFIQRTKAMRIIFKSLDNNSDMGVEEFTKLIIGIGSTVTITKEEHNLVTGYCKEFGILNHQAYKSLGIKVNGLTEFLEDKNILV